MSFGILDDDDAGVADDENGRILRPVAETITMRLVDVEMEN